MTDNDLSIPPIMQEGLPPVSGPGPRVLILGSFPSSISLRETHYYGNTQNRFWRIMEDLFSVNRTLSYEQRLDGLRADGIALWDVVRSCSREGSADSRIQNPVFNDVEGFVTARPSLTMVALNGGTAARYFRKAGWMIDAEIVHLPSTSPANARIKYNDLLSAWGVLKKG